VAQGNATTDGEASPERAIAPPSSAAEYSQHGKSWSSLQLLGDRASLADASTAS
jgi:hypothetical protein